MIKIYFQERLNRPEIIVELYSSINPIPFSVTVRKYSEFPATISCRSIHDQNLIEFRFRENDNVLFEITLVNIQSHSVKTAHELKFGKIYDSEFYDCCIAVEESTLENNFPIEILRTDNSICLIFDTSNLQDIEYYLVGPNLLVGVDDHMLLKSIHLAGLTSEEIYNVFGF